MSGGHHKGGTGNLVRQLIGNRRRWQELIRGTLAKNVLSLYSVHFAYYLLPLITVPYLTRVLGPAGWGYVAFTQAFTTAITILVEYGFNFSATRETARYRESVERRAKLLADVFAAKLLLAVVALAGVLIVRDRIPIFHEQPVLLWAGLVWSFGQAFNIMWYFQGLERMQFVASVDIVARLISTAGLFVFVHQPADAWKALVVPAAGSLLSIIAGLLVAYREVPLRLPQAASVIHGLKIGRSMFLFRAAESVYAVGGPFLLGMFSTPQYVAYYAGAEKLGKSFYGLLEPISRALYPRLSYLVQHSWHEACKTIRTAFLVMSLGGLGLGAVLFIAAPWLVRLLLGSQFEPAVAAVRVMSILPPAIAIKNVIGFHWMLPLGLDRTFNKIILTSCALHLTLIATIGWRFGYMGVAWAVALTELYVISGIYWNLRRRGLDPWAGEVEQPESARVA